jgi:hypothetical protein
MFLQQGVNVSQGILTKNFISAALIIAVLTLAAENTAVTPFLPLILLLARMDVLWAWCAFIIAAACITYA